MASLSVQSYLDRIGFRGVIRHDIATLSTLHECHLRAIPYENFDVQLGRLVDLSPANAYHKMVEARRGGWCYEMNGLFGWALDQLGFKVMRMAGGVTREVERAQQIGNHLVLCVDLDRPYLADVGFGDGMLRPIPLVAGSYSFRGFTYQLIAYEDQWWRFRNHALGIAPWFDFCHQTADEMQLRQVCDELRLSPDSKFVLNSVCMRHVGPPHPQAGETICLQGRVLRHVTPNEATKRLLETRIEYERILQEDFDIHLTSLEVERIWEGILARELARS